MKANRAVTAMLLAAVALALWGVAPEAIAESREPSTETANVGDACPDPRTCPNYTLTYPSTKGRWRPEGDGIARIPFYVNSTSAFLSREQAVELSLLTTATWEAYLPTVRFEYMGETTQPARPDDGLNVIQMAGASPVAVVSVSADERWLEEFDIQLDPWNNWDRCDPFADDSCTPQCSGLVCDVGSGDLQDSLMHELGHALGLAHPDSAQGCELTMGGGSGPPGCTRNNRKGATVGLGDVLGVHELYPFTCPTETTSDEEADRYRLVCPTIRIFAP